MSTIRVVSLGDLAEGDVRAWAELAERAVEPNPYLHPDFVLPAARAAGAMAEVRLAITEGHLGWEACVPLRPTRSWRRLPVPGTVAWMHDQCFLGTPLVARDDPARSLGDLLSGLRAGRQGVFAELDWIDAGGALGKAIDDGAGDGAFRFGYFSRATLNKRPENNYLEGRIKGKHRRSLRRMGRDMAAETGGDLELVDRAGERGAVETFLSLEEAGWKGRQGTALLSKGSSAGFFEEMCNGFATRGDLQLLFLEAGGRAVAARCNLRSGPVIFCFKVAYDEDLARFSPGMQLELAMIDQFHADPRAERMDSCAMPDSELFNRLWGDRRELSGLMLPLRGARGQAALPVLRAVTNAIGRRRARLAPPEASAPVEATRSAEPAAAGV